MMNRYSIWTAILCAGLLAGAAAADAPSLEIVSPKPDEEYDGHLRVVLHLRNLPPGRLLVRIHLGRVTHCFAVDPHLRPPQRPYDAPDAPPAYVIRDSWLPYSPEPQKLDVVAFYRDQPEPQLFSQSVRFTIKPAPAGADALRKYGPSVRDARIIEMERLLTRFSAAARQDPATREAITKISNELFLARRGDFFNQVSDLHVLHSVYVGALQYDRALGCLQKAQDLLHQADAELGVHPLKGRTDWRPGLRGGEYALLSMTDMQARLAQFDAMVQACEREIAFLEQIARAQTDADERRFWLHALARSHERMGFFHMLLKDDEQSLDEWQVKADKVREGSGP